MMTQHNTSQTQGTTNNTNTIQDMIEHENSTTDNEMTPERITIEDINITTEMNTSQMAIQRQQELTEDVPMHGYNLRRHLTKQEDRVSMAQTGEITGVEGIYDNKSQTTCTCHANTDERQQGLIKYGKEVTAQY